MADHREAARLGPATRAWSGTSTQTLEGEVWGCRLEILMTEPGRAAGHAQVGDGPDVPAGGSGLGGVRPAQCRRVRQRRDFVRPEVHPGSRPAPSHDRPSVGVHKRLA